MEESKGKNLCNLSHINEIAYFCNLDNLYLCEECATSHFDHLDKIAGIISLAQQKLPKYTNLKEKAKLVRKVCISPDELRNSIYKQIAEKYDKFITEITKYKENFIDNCFKLIFSEEEISEFEDPKRNLEELLEIIEESYTQIRDFCQEKNMNIGNLMRMEEPEILGSRMEALGKNNARLKQSMKISLDFNLDKLAINNMFHMNSGDCDRKGGNVTKTACVETPKDKYKEVESIFVAHVTNSEGIVRIYNIEEKRAYDIPVNREGFPKQSATCPINTDIYIGGNFSNDIKAHYFMKIDAIKETITELPKMEDGRANFCLVPITQNTIYAIGGWDSSKKYGTSHLNKCEGYSVDKCKWTPLPSLNLGRYKHGACFFLPTREIYIFGGYASSSGKKTDSIERLRVDNIPNSKWINFKVKLGDVWKPTADVMCRRVSDAHIYIFGRSNYMFDVGHGGMKAVQEGKDIGYLLNSRVSPVRCQGFIYCFDYEKKTQVFQYNIEKQLWSSIPC